VRSYESGRYLFNQGLTLGLQGKFDEAIATNDKVVEGYGGRSEANIVEQVAKALANKKHYESKLNPTSQKG
jgi:hypothetical protein